ncbi:50S ribosomal protein L21e [Candidatus Woesearchaeota archaeon CG08_land_8_20_14_0_20_47_9]|nr:MAG: 50S ribosomal protein L21e [Candidatus Woesearchaeota archaeon CG1_02_47_18]PIN71987.1 MAG: 50S ribosomal protein L21e [Candidatus Woesearchaeota archaeon CG10_big_fil_rev_8_21_14_0_10_47_5]PIO03714.1 MAG: 50S ribosomal protein L21e [Candidatus Woesearchaeota archaeon CG08_land_8_20_14_0_20_47_9]HII29899.1 50S ribosomal protein L21e [Candidatus Woesearchaeota archaeon]
MTQRTGSNIRKAKHKLTKPVRLRGKMPLKRYLQDIRAGDRIVLCTEPACQEGRYHMRFHGRAGVVSGKRGSCYKVEVADGGKTKCLIVHPAHLKRVRV